MRRIPRLCWHGCRIRKYKLNANALDAYGKLLAQWPGRGLDQGKMFELGRGPGIAGSRRLPPPARGQPSLF